MTSSSFLGRPARLFGVLVTLSTALVSDASFDGQLSCSQADEREEKCDEIGHRGASAVRSKVEDEALILADYYKRLDRSGLSLADWQADRFAFPDGRAAEFEALRVDECPSDFQIPRLNSQDVTTEWFRDMYESSSRPVMVKGIPEAMKWPAAKKWTLEGLESNYAKVLVRVGEDDDSNHLKMPLADFIRYARAQRDDSPLYVFDTHFVEHQAGRRMMDEYQVPELFPEDLFSCMADDRPPFRWLLVGPKRSGTSVHVDPLGTSAWNTLLAGRKLWILSPPGTLRELEGLPPHKEGKEDDGGERVEAINYFLDTLPRIKDDLKGKVNVTMLVQHPGETIFVPAGWAHGVLNLDDTVAVTQNFVSSANFDEVWMSVRTDRPKFAIRWLQRLLKTHPKLVLRALNLDEKDGWDSLAWRTEGDEEDDELGYDPELDDYDDDDDGYEDDDETEDEF